MALHFVGFTHPNIRAAGLTRSLITESDRYERAVRMFGVPDFVHQRWDIRAYQESDVPGDVVIIAQGAACHLPFTHDDSAEQ